MHFRHPSPYLLAACSLFICYACHHHSHEHEHHDVESYTAYSACYELYAEATPFIVDMPSSVTVHLTQLSDFKPVDSAQVTLGLQVGGRNAAVRVEKPVRPGIYRVRLTPGQAGVGRLTVVVRHSCATDTLYIDSVEVYDSHESFHRSAHPHHRPSGDIHFTKEQSWNIDFATAAVQSAPFDIVIRTAARILPSQGDECVVTAKVSGIVVLSDPSLVEGAAVHAGQRLCSIESGDMVDVNLPVRLQQASAAYDQAKSTYERQQQLADEHIVSHAELDRSRARYEETKVLYESLRRNTSGQGARATAPISGYVKEIAVTNGSYVEAGQPLMLLSRNRELIVRAEVPPRHFPLLHRITTANFAVGGHVYTLAELDGSVVGYGRSAEMSGPLIPVTFRVRNSVDWVPGTFVTAYICAASDSNVLTLPNTAVVEEMGNHFVFVQHTPERFEKRIVTLGTTDGLHTVITSGLESGERVVTKGAVMLKMAQATAVPDPHAGHFHTH
ncbi:MAG: RND family efflux transporter MFP subunit [bacterium P3]|nr:MAG: RND family efflux transporter MFP subunit [bacterium P3]KWW41463.1 MAG: RND family efflux transporter MFP subunit [bacterium F083]